MDYKAQWSEFEVQSLAFGILRKNLYPEYLIRGEYKFPTLRADIAIFKAMEDREHPELRCIVEVKKSSQGQSTAQAERYTEALGVPVVYVRGGPDAYKVLDLVKPYL